MKKLGIVGLTPLAEAVGKRLLDSGFELLGLIEPERPKTADLARKLGIPTVNSRLKLSEWSDGVILFEDQESQLEKHFLLTTDSLIGPSAKARVFVVCGTVFADVLLKLEAKLDRFNAHLVESCLPSPLGEIAEGKVVVLCGGRDEAVQAAKPILQALGEEVRHLGELGRATSMEALIGSILAVQTAALAEALALAEASGVKMDLLRDVFRHLGLLAPRLDRDWECMLKRNYSWSCPCTHTAKTAAIATKLARRLRLEVPLINAAKRQFDRMIKAGMGGMDRQAVAELTFRDRTIPPG